MQDEIIVNGLYIYHSSYGCIIFKVLNNHNDNYEIEIINSTGYKELFKIQHILKNSSFIKSSKPYVDLDKELDNV